ncbi:globin-1-like [Littorina saxatilis]|uniref:globin-1-like n=1 Tax=Littorina saxatilis TaxID=31220 RepID=UPI0038B68BCC
MGGQHSNCAHPKSKCYHAGSPKAEVVRVAPPELTSRQKQTLQTAWDQLERDIATVGVITFVGMFKTHPQVEDFFMPFTGLAKTDEQYSSTLRQHALRVMATVEKCIHRLDEPERMRNILEQLGSRHINYNAKIDYVDLLGSQFVMAVKENSPQWGDDLETSWLSLVKTITFFIKKGLEKSPLLTHQRPGFELTTSRLGGRRLTTTSLRPSYRAAKKGKGKGNQRQNAMP